MYSPSIGFQVCPTVGDTYELPTNHLMVDRKKRSLTQGLVTHARPFEH